ncbi:MAG: hypothetical protein HOK21_22865 [Rhodospirillaceae bacterium]|nr:hypothetical protein [Rhodospirillaceae bacterium]MBT5081496.1 hypothetical protein [Rhodospirillaceae bacterium]MBT5526938.1 hypothetical protein [Rhodospirillaceae bacterium]MBT5881834.1 hypothetical protein [Rhodospirillaceae bacterium]MBT6587539.1 hypothetical protein [Rhodospirillaceae bacterium]
MRSILDTTAVIIKDGHGALLRARRRHGRALWPDIAARNRHRGLVEGVHGEAKARHGLRRAMRRGLWNMQIQAWLTATVINLKRLARAFVWPRYALQTLKRPQCGMFQATRHQQLFFLKIKPAKQQTATTA